MDSTTFKAAEEFVYNVLLADKPLEKQMELYANDAHNYELSVEQSLYRFPEILTEEFDTLNVAQDSKILDVGAGTGLNGRLLKQLGYTNIDALDGCEQMLQHSKRNPGVYKNFITALVVADKELPIPENSYDVALMAGSASPAHIDVAAYKQIIRVVKPGGVIGWIIENSDVCKKVNSRFQDNLYAKTLKRFVGEKLWTPIDGLNPKTVPNAALGKPGDVYFFRILK